jgi:hypothetical protein
MSNYHDGYRAGFNRCATMATRICELLLEQCATQPQAAAVMRAYMAYFFSGHAYHLPTRYQDCGLAITQGLMRLCGCGEVYYRFNPDAVNEWNEENIV